MSERKISAVLGRSLRALRGAAVTATVAFTVWGGMAVVLTPPLLQYTGVSFFGGAQDAMARGRGGGGRARSAPRGRSGGGYSRSRSSGSRSGGYSRSSRSSRSGSSA